MGPLLYVDYVVEPNRGNWTVRLQGGNSAGAFPSRREAMTAALYDAERVCNLGNCVQVFARRSNGSLKRIARRPATRWPDRR